MNATKAVIEALEDLLSADGAAWVDELRVLEIRMGNLGDARPRLERLLTGAAGLRYESALVRVRGSGAPGPGIRHRVMGGEADVVLDGEVLDENLLCEVHGRAYEEQLRDQRRELALEPWERYGLLEQVGGCAACGAETWVEIVLDKGHLESRLKEAVGDDVPPLAGRLEGLHVLYWSDFDGFVARVAERPLEMQGWLAARGVPCLVVSSLNAANGGSAYLQSISTARWAEPSSAESVIEGLLGAPALDSVVAARRAPLEADRDGVRCLPPEYWVSGEILAAAESGGALPRWFVGMAPLFVISMLAAVSSRTSAVEDGGGHLAGSPPIIFEIERERTLRLACRVGGDAVLVQGDDGPTRVTLDGGVLSRLLAMYAAALQGKYSAVNRDLVQRAVVYGTSFAFASFFDRLEEIRQFYAFEYEHLLGDRFEAQSRTLSAFMGDMVDLRGRLASLVESLSKDLSGLTTAVLATAALSVVARAVDLESRESMVVYGLAMAPVVAYLYLPVFFLRIDSLKELGEGAIDGFLQDAALSEEIWDFPLHRVGIGEGDLDRARLLEPVARQHGLNEAVGVVCGLAIHLVFLALVAHEGVWWLLPPKVVVDAAFLGWGARRRPEGGYLLFYYGLVFVMTALAGAVYLLWLR